MNERIRRNALAGIVGPIGFLAIAFAMAALRSDVIATSGWASWPSSIATGGAAGVPQSVAFLYLCGCYVIFAVGALRPGLRSVAAWGGFLGIATGDILLAFPTDVGDAPLSWHGAVHVAGVIVVTAATVVATIAVAVATRRTRTWRPWRMVGTPVVLASALVGVVTGFDDGWAKIVFVVGITAPVPLIGILLRREPANRGSRQEPRRAPPAADPRSGD